jgi:hypothetical protein
MISRTPGFERCHGYARLRADAPESGEPLPRLRAEDYVATLELAYRGRWGHKQISREAEPPPGALVLGLYDGGAAVGLCTLFPEERLVDGPGVIASARRPTLYARLLAGACAELGPGAVDVESSGDDPDVIAAYETLGFAVVEQNAGWQLRLA